MRTKRLSFLALSFFIYLVSCKKDSSDTPVNVSIEGNYKFISLAASTVSTQIISDGTTVDKTVTFSNYITKNNTGTVTIDDKNIVSTGLSYSVDTIAKTYFYEDGELIDSLESEFAVDVPVSSATSGYHLVTNDSIQMTSGSMLFNGTMTTTEPAGARFKLEGNNLYIFASKSQTSQTSQSGYTINSKLDASIVATYQKQ